MTAAATHRVAVLTPPGAGAIALIRIVGPDAIALVNTLFEPKSGSPLSPDSLDHLRYGRFVDDGETIDDVVATAIVVGGRRAVDVTCHGGVRVVERILQALAKRGAEVCESDEAAAWTWEAASPLDREILDAMTHAKTERALRFLAYQRTHLLDAIGRTVQTVESNPAGAAAGLLGLIDGYSSARALVEGVSVALIGPPNSGKSTLFNRLLGRDAVVVSEVAGTTRDWIAEPVEMFGLPVTLIDTAGRHEATSPLEDLAIEAGIKMAERADLRITVLEAGEAPSSPDVRNPRPPDFLVWNKADLRPPADSDPDAVAVSARSGAGIEQLARRILAAFGVAPEPDPHLSLFTESQFTWATAVLAEIRRSPKRAAEMLRERTERIPP